MSYTSSKVTWTVNTHIAKHLFTDSTGFELRSQTNSRAEEPILLMNSVLVGARSAHTDESKLSNKCQKIHHATNDETAFPPEPDGSSSHSVESSGNDTVDILNIDPRAVDAMLANELQQLSFQHREAVNEEIHGVRTLAPEESPEKIRTSLQEMQKEIENGSLPKDSYNKAIEKGSKYVIDDEFRLKFLRANYFDARKAAANFVKYLGLLEKYFGEDALMRPLYFSDLGSGELELLRAGHMNLFSQRDRSGRRVLNVFGSYRKEHTVFSKIKLALYMYGLASDDEETKKNGLVLIIAPTSEQQSVSDPEEHVEVAKFAQTMPLRFAAIHICLPDEGPVFHLLRATIVLLFASDQRIRVKFHTGLKTELRYQLMTFGIPVADLPESEDGMIDSGTFQSLVRTRTAVDLLLKSSGKFCVGDSYVECPMPHDILFSRGGNYWSHVGNVKFRHLLESKREMHQAAKNNESKSRIIREIAESLRAAGFRFLVLDKINNLWQNLTDPVAVRNKVAVSMRDHCKRRKERSRVQNNNCSTYQFATQDSRKRKQSGGLFCGHHS